MNGAGSAGNLRRHYRLPEADEEYLNGSGLLWETVIENNVRWLVIRNFPISSGYTVEKADAALVLDPNYPDTQIDMAYFSPALARYDRRGIGALSFRLFDGRSWQQWSRHRTAANPWRPGVDCVATHLLMFTGLLERELLKG